MKKFWEFKFQWLAAALMVAAIMSRGEGAAVMVDLAKTLGPVLAGGVVVAFLFRGIKAKAGGIMEKAMEEAKRQPRQR
ncbi:MAG: hypothetical protein RIQ81_2554 [Pseudomonadota bacterium]|jgi:hypothetical protein